MKKPLIISLVALAAISCGNSSNRFPDIGQKGRIAVVAHRGFWNCEAAGMSQNSIASLKAAQDSGLWGSEFDIHLTKDRKVIVNHDGSINGKEIEEYNFSDFDSDLLPNGEKRPSLDEYLAQGEKCRTTMLVMEIKPCSTPELEDILVDKSIQALKDHGLFSPDRVLFISFSKHICDRIAADAPAFVNQYLNGDLTPAELAADGINGWDYEQGIILENHNEWIKEGHDLGMSTNVWTVNEEEDAAALIELGVDAITTNFPLMVRDLLGEKECTR